MTGSVEYLDLDDLVGLCVVLFGEPPPIRDMGLLGAAAARPRTTVFGDDAYGDLWTKAAAFLHSIVKNHALVDGNKRLGWLACAVFLDINGVDPTVASNDDVVDVVMAVASGSMELEEIARRLESMIAGR